MRKSGLMRYGAFLVSATAARVAGILITSLTFPYIVRVLGVETYGLWSYVVALVSVLNIVADPGITTYVTQRVATQRLDASDLLADYFVLRLLGTALGTAVVAVVAHWEPRADVAHLLRLYGIGFLIVNLVSADHFLTALEFFHARSMLTVVQQSAYAVIIFLAVRISADVVWIPIAILSSSFLSALVGWAILFHRGLRIPTVVQPGRWRQILVPSFHYAASTLMSSIYHRSGHLLVRWFLGDYALGLFSAAVRLVDLLGGFVTSIVYVLMPRLAIDSQSLPNFRRTIRRTVAAIAAASIPMTFGLLVTAGRLVPWILGAKFIAAVAVVKWMSPYVVTASAASLWAGTVLYAMGQHRAYFAATAGGAISGIFLYLLLIPTFGLNGAALAFVTAEVVVTAIALLLLPVSLRDLWKNPVAAVALAASLLMSVVVQLGNIYAIRLPLLICAGVAVYLISCGWYARRWFYTQLLAA